MIRAVLLGHEEFDRLLDQLLSRIAKDAFRLGVDQSDPAVLVDDQHGIGGRFQDAPGSLLEPLALRDVLHQTVVMLQHASIIAVADNCVADPADLAILVQDAMFEWWNRLTLQ